MRFVTWNLGYLTPATYKGVDNRRRQWEYLLNLEPTVALLQECRPEDLDNLACDRRAPARRVRFWAHHRPIAGWPQPGTVVCMSDALDQRQRSLSNLATRLESEANSVERLRVLCLLDTAVRAETRATVEAARRERLTWSEIGASLGISKQAASQRFGTRIPPGTVDQAGTTAEQLTPTKPSTRATRAKGWRLLTPGGRTMLRVERDL